MLDPQGPLTRRRLNGSIASAEIFPPPQKSAATIGGLKDYRTESKLFTLVALTEDLAASLTRFRWHKTAQATSIEGTSLCYSSRSSSAALWLGMMRSSFPTGCGRSE